MRIILLGLLYGCLWSQASFLDQVIELNKILEPELKEQELRSEYKRLLDACREKIGDQTEPKQIIQALNDVLLKSRNVAYLSNVYWRDASLNAAIMNKQCNCLAGSTLYMCIGRDLKLPIKMVFSPGHAFVRWEDDNHSINIETTQGGIQRSDQSYAPDHLQYHDPEFQVTVTYNGIGEDKCLAELMYVAAGQLISRGQLKEGIEMVTKVCAALPDREDYALHLLRLHADHSKDRQTFRSSLGAFIDSAKTPAMKTQALLYLADEYSDLKQFDRERRVLLYAFRVAPKDYLKRVLHSLAFCHRSLKDYRAARRYFELYGALANRHSPKYASYLYNMAILQKNDNDLDAAIASINQGIAINPESWNLQVIKAGYLVLNNQREQGLKVFAAVKQPRGDLQFWNIMQAWFFAVSKQDEQFYKAFEHALSTATNPSIFTWIAQDVDLDHYRKQERFQKLVASHRQRILGR